MRGSLTRRFVVVAAAVAAISVALAGCSGDHEATHASGSASVGSAAMDDVLFAQLMIPHHQQAVEMSTMALDNPTASPEVKALAQRIAGAQDPEIATMRGWLSAWGAEEMPMGDHSDHGAMGMMSDEDMSMLSGLDGAEFDEMWLTMMVSHHEGAVAMAEQVLLTTKDPQVKAFAEQVIAAQQGEIDEMKALLGTMPSQ